MSPSITSSSSPPNFFTPLPPLPTGHTLLSFPTPQILLVTLNRPDQLNCINAAQHAELHSVWEWLDREPRLRCGIITGKGRAFCAGADLQEWSSRSSPSDHSNSNSHSSPGTPPSGFGGLSRRRGKTPILAAVNGICYGGGFEMVVNCDMVLASPSAMFALPEVKVGVVALAGALPRLGRVVGRQRGMEMVLTGRGEGGGSLTRSLGMVMMVVVVAREGKKGRGGIRGWWKRRWRLRRRFVGIVLMG
ncbi:MAG: hypothetical protein LQ343_004505 [Gyalolechia ehrenbergii]|nr:MAG: hypothetical protein LQ343_004505 [Gyalolechia ehrenbergii]